MSMRLRQVSALEAVLVAAAARPPSNEDSPPAAGPWLGGLSRSFVTWSNQAERRVKKMERWLAATLTSIGDGVIYLDLNGRVNFMNSVAQRLTGWDLETAMNR